MTSRRDDVFVVRAVEDADVAARRQRVVDAPEEVVRELGRRRRLERLDVAALRIQTGEHAPDRAVLARRVEALQHEQHRAGALGVEAPLQHAQPIGEPGQLLLGLALFDAEPVVGRPAREIRLGSGLDPARVAHGGTVVSPVRVQASLHVLGPPVPVPVPPPSGARRVGVPTRRDRRRVREGAARPDCGAPSRRSTRRCR